MTESKRKPVRPTTGIKGPRFVTMPVSEETYEAVYAPAGSGQTTSYWVRQALNRALGW